MRLGGSDTCAGRTNRWVDIIAMVRRDPGHIQEFIGKRRMNRWFAIRLVIVVLAATSGLDGTASSASREGIDWWTYLGVCGIVFAVVMIGGFCAIGGAYQTKG